MATFHVMGTDVASGKRLAMEVSTATEQEALARGCNAGLRDVVVRASPVQNGRVVKQGDESAVGGGGGGGGSKDEVMARIARSGLVSAPIRTIAFGVTLAMVVVIPVVSIVLWLMLSAIAAAAR